MLPFRIMYPHIGFLVGLFRLCGFCSAPPRSKLRVWSVLLTH